MLLYCQHYTDIRKNINCNHVTGLVCSGGREVGRVTLLIMGGRETGDGAGEGCVGEGRILIISQDWISCFQM